MTGSVLDATAPAVILLSGYLAALSSTIDSLPLGALPAARNATIELLAAALQTPALGPHSTGATRSTAETYIERNLRENRLSAGEISRAIGVSVRSLQRAFEESGDSVSAFIRLRRLARARDDLTSGLTVSQVARRWHYTDPSHFSRSFKRHFGVNPSDLAAHTDQYHCDEVSRQGGVRYDRWASASGASGREPMTSGGGHMSMPPLTPQT